jgi:hypothetical protein
MIYGMIQYNNTIIQHAKNTNEKSKKPKKTKENQRKPKKGRGRRGTVGSLLRRFTYINIILY